MIKVENLTKKFGNITAIDNISFEVAKGDIVGFLGPNGAGKTTTMRILACFLPPTGGKVTIGDADIITDSIEVRKKIGYLPENVPLYTDMRVNEYLKYRGQLKGLSGKLLKKRTDDVIGLCGLGDSRKRIIGHLSKGYRQRIGLADSLINEPEVLILDEPTIGLDPNQIRAIRELIKGLGGKQTVLLSSHLLSEVEMTCRRVLIINKGKIVASDMTDNLSKIVKGNIQIIAEIKADKKQIAEKVSTISGIIQISCVQNGEWTKVVCETAGSKDMGSELFAIASSSGWQLRELRTERKNLEDVFVALTAGDDVYTQG